MKSWLYDVDRVDVMPRPDGTDLRYSEWTKCLPKGLFKYFLKTLTWKDFALYPDTNLLKDKIAKVHGIESANVFLAPGSSEAIRTVFECLSPNAHVVTTDPCFPMYDVYVKQNMLQVSKIVPWENLSYSMDSYEADLIVFSRPSNPTGCMFSRQDVIHVLEQNPGSIVLVDEAYIEFAIDYEDITDLIIQYDNLVISRSFSKVFGAAGCRLGYLMSCAKNINLFSKLRQMYEVSGPSMKYAMFLLDNKSAVTEYCKKTQKSRKKLCKLFRSAKLGVISSSGNWIHVEQTDSFVALLNKHNIKFKGDVSLPYHDNKWVRLTVGPGVHKLFRQIVQEL